MKFYLLTDADLIINYEAHNLRIKDGWLILEDDSDQTIVAYRRDMIKMVWTDEAMNQHPLLAVTEVNLSRDAPDA